MLHDNTQRKQLIDKILLQLQSAQKETDKLLGENKNNSILINQKLIDFSFEILELWKRGYSQRDYQLYKERLQILIGITKSKVPKAQNLSKSGMKISRKPSSENEFSAQQESKSKTLKSQQNGSSFVQQIQLLKEDDFSDISFASLSDSKSDTIQEIIEHQNKNQDYCQIHNCRELRIMREIFRQKIDINELQIALDEIKSLKSQIRMKLQKELQKVQNMHEKLIEGERKIKRLEEYEKEQSTILKQKQKQLLLD